MRGRTYGGLDTFRLIAALMVVSIHTGLVSLEANWGDTVLCGVLARVAVPFFLMTTGFFTLRQGGNWKRAWRKTALLYAVAILLYLPLQFYTGYFSKPGLLGRAFLDLFFEGTFYHLWYFPAVLLALPLTAALLKRLKPGIVLAICVPFYLVGLLGDSYYGLTSLSPALTRVFDNYFAVFEYTRNGLFYAPIFLSLGALCAARPDPKHAGRRTAGLIGALALMLAEGITLHWAGWIRHDSMYLALPLVSYLLFRLLCTSHSVAKPVLREMAGAVYIVHPMMIVAVRGIAGVLGLDWLLVNCLPVHFFSVSVLSLAVCGAFVLLARRIRRPAPSVGLRAWREIDFGALRHNVKTLESWLPQGAKLMAVLKAEAYGHGLQATARTLADCGVDAFAVATLEEGIALRRLDDTATILILGYTDPAAAPYLKRYRLTQTVFDAEYAHALSSAGKGLHVHLKIDTGMHRLGFSPDDPDALIPLFADPNLKIDGMFTHFCVADSNSDTDIAFTNEQRAAFLNLVEFLRARGLNVGKLHMQSSYGLLNYPDIPCDYARVGLALYGAADPDRNERAKELRPVLSLHAKIVTLHTLAAGETAGYDRAFLAQAPCRLATVSIGYADGVPRSLGEGGGYVLVGGQRAPVVGRVCMDQMLIDVSGLEVEQGMTVTLIGRENAQTISCVEFSKWCGTIPNEILSRLGERLSLLYKTR